MFDTSLQQKAALVLAECKKKGITLATAESCTGGLLAGLFTEIPGSSATFQGGVVSYSNALKEKLLGVSHATLEAHGAVSPEVAKEMAVGARHISNSDIAISITGIAGPDGGTDEKPVGLVYIGYAAGDAIEAERHDFVGDRSAVREQTVQRCLKLLEEILSRSFSASA